ncbi:hypothetical protein BD769DRAFT_1396431 [Suillus cothurnatus]|nr:hypothetical protein BD769DRAFT_1396431 [Suillus cothurnatus]
MEDETLHQKYKHTAGDNPLLIWLGVEQQVSPGYIIEEIGTSHSAWASHWDDETKDTSIFAYYFQDHYEAFMWMVCEWWHVTMLKCFGCGHDPTGVNGTSEGEYMVLCPACPQPGRYSIFIAIDANFWLKRCNVSSDVVDPSLSEGWAYFIEERKYKAFLSQHLRDEQELSQGLAATGMGTVNCAHHNMRWPNGVGDLQKARNSEAPERGWSNINPVALSTKAMGPGCHCDMLDNHFRDWNWKKTVGLGTFLLLKMKNALAEKAKHKMAFKEFDTGITPDHHSTWLAEMEAWEGKPNDTTIPNPLEDKAMSIMQADAQLELAELEAEELQ